MGGRNSGDNLPGRYTPLSQHPANSTLTTLPLRGHAERAADLLERFDGPVDVGGLVGGAQLDSDARLVLGDHRVRETDDVNALVEQCSRHGDRETRIAKHNGDDGVDARLDAEARF